MGAARLRHLVALPASVVADGLVYPKLVLSWLMTDLGAGLVLTGFLVPFRESGALLPLLLIAGRIRAMAAANRLGWPGLSGRPLRRR